MLSHDVEKALNDMLNFKRAHSLAETTGSIHFAVLELHCLVVCTMEP